MANEFIARKGLIVLTNGATITGSLKTQGDINSVGYNVSASRFSGSFYGDGSNLVNITATTLDIDAFGSDLTGITVAGTDKLILSDAGTEGRINVSQLSTPLAGTGLEANAGTIRIAADAAGNGLTGGAGSAIAVGAGDGISVTADAVSLDTSSVHFLDGVKKELNTEGVISSSAQFTSLTAPFTGSFTGSFKGDGSNLTGIASTLTFSGSTGSDTLNLKTEALNILGTGAITTTVTDNTVTTALNTSSVHFISGARGTISVSDTTGASGIDLTYNSDTGVLSGTLVNSSVTVNGQTVSLGGSTTVTANTTNALTLGSGLTGTSFNGSTAVTATVDTSSAHFLDGVKKELNTEGVVSSSAQIDVRNTTGIATIATTGSNTFTGVQTISNTTNSTTFANGALIVQGGIGVAKDVNISGSLNVTGVLTAVTMSTQYVTSSQYTVGVSRILLNDDDLVRFSGISVVDSGSTFGTGSLLWDSFNNRWIVETDDADYESGTIILGPKNFGTLGNEPVLINNRVPVGFGDHHIDNRVESSSIYIDFTNKKTYIEAGLYVTGSVSSSVGFSGSFYGDGSNLSGIATNLQQITNNGASTTNQLTLNGGVVIHGVLYTSGSNPDVDTGTEIITTLPSASYDAAYFDYVVKKSTNYRAGTVMAVWDKAGNVEYTDTSTNDIGNTAEALMIVDTLNADIRLKTTVSTNDWIVKTVVRAL